MFGDAGSRDLLQDAAPAQPEALAAVPAASAAPLADLTFILSASAGSLARDRLILTGVLGTAQYLNDDMEAVTVRLGTPERSP